ncbi:tetratricopeptide repeat protein, partial [Fulvivirga sp. RKSG066]|uniref:OmpA family protein n=1 Tax=Fulvivirga aurantia TaxID=2529383 RepID=UPI0012BB5600
MKQAFVFFLLAIVPLFCFSQQKLSTKSKKATELYYEADNYWVRGQYTAAYEILQTAVDKDKNFLEAYFRLGVIDKSRGNTSEAEKYLQKTLELKPDHAGANFELGELYIQIGKYQKSIEATKRYLALNPRNTERKSQANRFITNAEYALENLDSTRKIFPEPLPKHINQYAMQYFPVITADQKTLLYTRRLGTTMNHDEDLVVAKKGEGGNWSEPQSISDNINSSFNEGTCTISADGRTLIFTSCYGRNGYGSCDLYMSKKTGDEWSRPENLGPKVNSSAWDSQPSLSADGRTLYFVSNRPGGVGARDIWITSLDDSEVWGKPTNPGGEINTKFDEVSPFIHPNSKTLFFSSNGRKGFGGFDIYLAEKVGDNWGEPENIGYPINTGEDQVSLFVTADGKKGYYSHENLDDPKVKGEIYQFEIPEDLQIDTKARYVEGIVYDIETNDPLDAKVELYDVKKDQRISMVYSDSINGSYLMVLPEGEQYALYVNKPGYLFNSKSFDLSQELESEQVEIKIPLQKITLGGKAVLENIFFEFDSYEIKAESKTELNKVVSFLKDNKDIQIQIAGHTDSKGDEGYNQNLSEKRARAVYHYLIEAGASATQLEYRGYGDKKPLFDNSKEEGRQRNRRIEFEII